jgi:putative membrane protein
MGNLIPFVEWFGISVVLMGGFGVIYRYVTPHPEIKLIREGNVSTAVAFGGALLGYALPLASVMVHGVNLADLARWGLVAMLVQLGVYFALRALFKDYTRHIAEDRIATAVFGAFVSVAIGILNAAAQST